MIDFLSREVEDDPFRSPIPRPSSVSRGSFPVIPSSHPLQSTRLSSGYRDGRGAYMPTSFFFFGAVSSSLSSSFVCLVTMYFSRMFHAMIEEFRLSLPPSPLPSSQSLPPSHTHTLSLTPCSLIPFFFFFFVGSKIKLFIPQMKRASSFPPPTPVDFLFRYPRLPPSKLFNLQTVN